MASNVYNLQWTQLYVNFCRESDWNKNIFLFIKSLITGGSMMWRDKVFMLYSLPSSWLKQCKSTVNSSIVFFICGTTWKFPSFSTSLSLPALFPLQSECNQLWHEKTRSLSVRTLLVFRWQSSADSPPPPSPKTASLPPPCLPSLTSAVLMNIKMPLGPPKHLWSLG